MTSETKDLGPVKAAERVEAIDIVRGLALFGVLQVNLVTEFRISIFKQFLTRHTESGFFNHLVDDVLSIAVFFKALALFSLLFGVGLAAQYERVEAAGKPFMRLALRRLLVLLAIGLVHLFLIWNGDILTLYALVGLVAAPFLRCTTKTLLVLASIALVAYVCPIPYPNSFPSRAALSAHVQAALVAYGAGSFLEVLRFRVHEVRPIAPLLLSIVPRTLGLYFLGAVAWRERLFNPAEEQLPTLRAIAALGLVGGGLTQLLTFLSAASALSLGARSAAVLDGFGQVALALGYAAGIVLLARRRTLHAWLAPFGQLGRAALTNYLLQSVVFGWLFYGYGGGLFDTLGSASAAALGVFVFAVQVALSVAWFKRFRFGPVEWLWRSATYGELQPLTERNARELPPDPQQVAR